MPLEKGVSRGADLQTAAPDKEQTESAVRNELAGLLIANTPLSVAVSLVVMLMVALVPGSQLPPVQLFSWCGYMLVALVARTLLYLEARTLQDGDRTRIADWYTALVLMIAVGWGYAGVALVPNDSLPYELFNLLLLAGLVSGAAVSLGAHLPSYAGFALFTLVPAILHHFWVGGEFRLALGGAVLTFLLFSLGTAWRQHQTLANAIRLKLHNGRLAGDLAREQQQLCAANASLEAKLTELEGTQLALIGAKQQAEAASHAKSEFLSRMSHELRTPLNAVLGFSQLLQLEGRLSSEQRELAEEVHKAGRHLLAMLNEIFDLSSIESGTFRLQPESVNLVSLVQESLAAISDTALHKRVSLSHRRGGKTELWIKADRGRIRQILGHLLSNALKFTPPGGAISVSYAIEGQQYLRVNVRDSGPGIDPAERHLLFKPFSRLDAESGQVEGVGVGLVICKRLVEMMGGRIGLASEPGEGSLFWFELPLPEVRQLHPELPGGSVFGGEATQNLGRELRSSRDN